jgi:hypothetical protein
MAPALVPVTPITSIVASSSRRSSTPHVKAPCDPPPCKAKATLRRSGAAARSASALDDAAAKPNANGDPSTDNAIRREIIPVVILPIMSASKTNGHFARQCSRGASLGKTVCRASLIMWLSHFIYVKDEATRAQTRDSKRRLNHVCSKHTVNLWRYYRLQDQW